MSPSVIVMTATIQPPSNMPDSGRKDPDLRLNDYLEALSFYLDIDNKYVDRIIFTENSGSDLSQLKELVELKKSGKKVEFISFTSKCEPRFGKGYSELYLLDKTIMESSLLAEKDVIWKVTGRLRFKNLERLIVTAPLNYSCYCDLRNLPIEILRLGKISWIWNGYRFMDTRIFSCSVKAYKRYILGQYKQIETPYKHPCGDSYMIENFLFEIFYTAYKNQTEIIPRFNIQPIIQGVRGQSNCEYQSFAGRCKVNLRRISRKVLPFVWC
jgi:hypothetical protein